MEIDKVTLEDLSVFNKEEEYSVFHLLDYTRTSGGRWQLRRIFEQPLSDLPSILAVQDTIRFLSAGMAHWPKEITNGTLMVMDKYFETGHEPVPHAGGRISLLNSVFYRIVNAGDYSLIRYSLTHFGHFLAGFQKILSRFGTPDCPPALGEQLRRAAQLLSRKEIRELQARDAGERLRFQEVLYFGHAMQHTHRQALRELMDIYHRLDAWYAMARAIQELHFAFPELQTGEHPQLEVRGLFHPLLKEPVGHDVILNKDVNFLFLTGANMSGKSTFIKAVGLAVFLAHIGMGVPAASMKLTLFDGLLSNIQVTDNIFLGESYFYNEVQRVKKTILKISNGRRWLILIDELFKGTNFLDAQQCSAMVIEGLLQMRNSLFVLSTHLYEIADGLRSYPNIAFRYFETFVENETPRYTYRLKEGISNDRLGFLILKREKVIDLLHDIVREDSGAGPEGG